MLEKYAHLLSELGKEEKISRKKDDKVLIVDGLNTFIRCFISYPTLNEDGEHIGGIVGFLKSIGHAIKLFNATRVVIVFDGKGGSSKRRKQFEGYKTHRKTRNFLNRPNQILTPEEEQQSLLRQGNLLTEYLLTLPVTLFAVDGVEADDIISYLAVKYFKKNVVIYSSDKDFLQLIDDRIHVWSPTKKILYDRKTFFEHWGIYPENYYLLKIVEGDISDNVPGVRGIGKKTLLKNIPRLKEEGKFTLGDLKELTIKNKEHKFFKKLSENWDIIERNNNLMTLEVFDFDSRIKSRVLEKIKEPVPGMDILQFKKLFVRDKMVFNIGNLDLWLRTTFLKLTQYD